MEKGGDFENLSSLWGYLFVSFGNGVGDFRVPTYDADSSSDLIVWMVYMTYMIQMVLMNTILLNFVIAVIGQEYESVMNQQVLHVYTQKHELNNEVSRTLSLAEDVISKGKQEESDAYNIILDCSRQTSESSEWTGVIQTLKRFIKDKVIANFEASNAEIKAKVDSSNAEIKAEVREVKE